MTRIHIVGDSISIQYGPYLQAMLADTGIDYSRKSGEAEALLNLDNPQGANGGDSDRVLTYLKTMVKEGQLNADLLLVNCGLHDIKTNPDTGAKQVPLERYVANLKAMVQLADSQPWSLVWIRTTPCNEHIHNRMNRHFHRFATDCQAYNQAADRVMAEGGCPIIDLYTFTANLGGDSYCDHVHFTESVRQQQAAYMAGWLAHYRLR